jgi:hypothetical protein
MYHVRRKALEAPDKEDLEQQKVRKRWHADNQRKQSFVGIKAVVVLSCKLT